jgi:hypothetical protein
MERLLQFLQEDNGRPSSTRLVMVLLHVAIISVWTTLSIKSGHMVELDPGILIALGISSAQKITQKIAEKHA